MGNDFKIILEAMIDNSSLSNAQKQVAKERLKINADISVEDFSKSKHEIEKQILQLGKSIKTILGDAINDKQANQWAKQYYDQMITGAKQAAKEQEKLNQKLKASIDKEVLEYRKKEVEYERERKRLLAEGKKQQTDALAEKEALEFYEQERYYQETRAKYLAEGKRQQEAYNHQVRENAKLERERNEYYKQFAKESDKSFGVKQSIDNGTYESKMFKVIADANKWTSENTRIKSSIDELKVAYANLINPKNADHRVANEEIFQQALTKTQNIIAIQSNQYASDDRVQNLLGKYVDFSTKNTKAMRNKNWAKTIKDGIDELSNGVPIANKRFDELELNIAQVGNAARHAGKLGFSAFDKFKNAIEKFGGWSLATGALMKGVNKVRDAISELKEIDTYLTEISKANDKLSKSQLAKIGTDSFGVGSKYGKQATSYLSAMQETSRAGYDNAEGMAELSVAIQGAGDVTEDTANKYLIATDKAYKLEGQIKSLTAVFDGANKITNENAVNMQELADGMSIVGSTAASFGVEANETTAALGTMIATTQQSGSEAARAYRAILLNIRQVSDEEEGINAEGLTKYEEACNALNVKLKETKNGVLQLRDPMEVLRELSVEYNKLDENDIKRSNLLSSLGSKLRSTQLDALLRNWDMYEKMLDDYANGTGSMAKEAEKTAKSWEGSTNRMSNSWTKLVDGFTNQDAIIGTINILSGLLDTISKLIEKHGALWALGGGIGALLTKNDAGRIFKFS